MGIVTFIWIRAPISVHSMMNPLRSVGLLTLAMLMLAVSASAVEADPRAVVEQVVNAAGGDDKLLKLFRMKERLNVSSDAQKQGSERVSVLEPPNYWWLGKKERVKDDREPATFLVWAWTLRALTDPASQVEVIPSVTESDKPAVGLRVSGTIDPPPLLRCD